MLVNGALLVRAAVGKDSSIAWAPIVFLLLSAFVLFGVGWWRRMALASTPQAPASHAAAMLLVVTCVWAACSAAVLIALS